MAVHVWPQTPWRQKQPSSHDCVAEMAVGFVGPLSLDASRGELSRLHLGRHAAATKSHPLLRKLLNISERFCATRCKMPTNWPLFNPYVRCFVYSVSCLKMTAVSSDWPGFGKVPSVLRQGEEEPLAAGRNTVRDWCCWVNGYSH